MQNRLLQITRGGIPYLKDLRPRVKTVTACLLMQQLDYWFERFPNGFWKFTEPAEGNPQYREGDSWQEELGFSAEEFTSAFSHIGVKYVSKKQFDKAENKFIPTTIDPETKQVKYGEEKFYCAYTDKRTGITYYYRNHKLVDGYLNQIITANEQREASKPLHSVSVNRELRTQETGNNEHSKPTITNTVNRESRSVEPDNAGLIDISKTTSETTKNKKKDPRSSSFIEEPTTIELGNKRPMGKLIKLDKIQIQQQRYFLEWSRQRLRVNEDHKDDSFAVAWLIDQGCELLEGIDIFEDLLASGLTLINWSRVKDAYGTYRARADGVRSKKKKSNVEENMDAVAKAFEFLETGDKTW